MVPGGARGLQNHRWAVKAVHGEFDSHTLPPLSHILNYKTFFIDRRSVLNLEQKQRLKLRT